MRLFHGREDERTLYLKDLMLFGCTFREDEVFDILLSHMVMGFRRFSIRGLHGAAGEWDLVCLATNLRRMRALIQFQ